MTRRVEVKLRPGAVRSLLRSPEMRRDLEQRADRIANAAGPGFESDSAVGRNRARATVWTDTFEARYAEATTRDLTRAIDFGRG